MLEMTISGKILVVGDIHGRWWALNNLVVTEAPDIILQCGDFGFWPGWSKFALDKIELGTTKLFWLDGNHENHEQLRKLGNNPVELRPNLFYMPRGSKLCINKSVVLFLGGAHSIDKDWRTPGYDWFPEELLTEVDVAKIGHGPIDVVLSHTCPHEFDMTSEMFFKINDPSRDWLTYVLNQHLPHHWFFGHFHAFKEGCTAHGCHWTGLNMADKFGWCKDVSSLFRK